MYVLTPTPEEFLVVSRVSPEERASRKGHTGGVLWFTGLSAAGKSTLALGLEHRLHKAGYDVFLLDGDNIRAGLCADLDFSPEGRQENIRRIGEVAALFAQAGMIVLTAFISPYRSDRARARETVGAGFHEVFVKASLAECERRDPKGLYAKARRGELAEFTGISAPYECPEHPELVIETTQHSPEECLVRLEAYVVETFGRPRG